MDTVRLNNATNKNQMQGFFQSFFSLTASNRTEDSCIVKQKETKLHNLHNQRYRKKYPKKRQAKNAVYYAAKTGKIPKVQSMGCSCGNQAQHYHHDSYEYEHRLNVIPVCKPCHRELHLLKNRRKSNE